MNRSIFMAICLSAAAAFAGPYDIDEFTAQDVGTPDEYITAEFGGELKVAPVNEVSSLQEGRLVVRQKFEDPFGESETAYQLYQGGAGDLSSMTALSVPDGASYDDIVKAKLYKRRGMDAGEDFEKVYFDGKSVYIPNQSSAIAFVAGDAIELKGDDTVAEEEAAPVAAAPAPAAEEECDEYDPDCEDEDEDEDYDVAGNLDKTNAEADERDNSADDAAYDASENATDRFGIADEVRFWSAVALSAIAATSAVLGILEHMEANKAGDAYDELDDVHDQLYGKILQACSDNAPESVSSCVAAMSYYDLTGGSNYSLKTLEKRMDTNKKTQDSHATARNIWFGVTGVTLTAAIVLFVW